VFLVVFAIIFFYAGLQSTPSATKQPAPALTSTRVTAVTPQTSSCRTPDGKPCLDSQQLPEFIPDAPTCRTPEKKPCIDRGQTSSRANATSKRLQLASSDPRSETDPILAAIRGTSEHKQASHAANAPDRNPLRTENARERAFGPALRGMYGGSPHYSCPIGSHVELASDDSAWCVSDASASEAARTQFSTQQTGVGPQPSMDSRPTPLTQSRTQSVTTSKDLPDTGRIILDNAHPTTVSKPAEPPTYLGAPHSAPTARRTALSDLTIPEQQSIEAACSTDKYNNGPAAYNRCLQNQLNLLSGAPRRPDLSSLSGPERTSIEAACSTDKYNYGPAAYNRCLARQLGLLRSSR
jgi:hypothetical protein